MRVRRFYPKQVAKKLNGKEVDSLGLGERSALTFFFKRGRKYGISISVVNNANREQLLAASNAEDAEAVQREPGSRVWTNTHT